MEMEKAQNKVCKTKVGDVEILRFNGRLNNMEVLENNKGQLNFCVNEGRRPVIFSMSEGHEEALLELLLERR